MSGSSSIFNLMIFDLYAVVRNVSVKVAHSLIGSFFWCSLFFYHLRLKWMSSEEFRIIARRWVWRVIFLMLTTIFFFVRFFPLALESYDDDSDESNNDRSGCGVLPSLYVLLFFKLSVDRVIWFLSSWVLSSQVTIFSMALEHDDKGKLASYFPNTLFK